MLGRGGRGREREGEEKTRGSEGERRERGRESPEARGSNLNLNSSLAKTVLASETFLLQQRNPNPICTLQSKKGFFAGSKNTEANRPFVERVQLLKTRVLCSLHNGVAISYFEQTKPQSKTHGLGSV